MPTQIEQLSAALRKLAPNFGLQLNEIDLEGFENYYGLVLKWNPRLHLVAPCAAEEFAARHILESLVLLPHLTPGAQVIDVGSGAGLPIIPCLTVRSCTGEDASADIP